MRRYHEWTTASILVLVLLIIGCQKEIVPEAILPTKSHEEYSRALRSVNLDKAALGKEWLAAADRMLESAVPIDLPYRIEGYWDTGVAEALGFSFPVKTGQRIDVIFGLQDGDDYRVFIDLFRLPANDTGAPVLIASYLPGQIVIPVTALSDAAYLLRVQPELLRGGRYQLSVSAGASLEFPVEGKSMQHIGSFFGDSRDGGARQHHGIDIFAARGTSVLAPAAGQVSRVGTSVRGGNIIYVRDPEVLVSYYFAHLETQDIEEGTWVKAGDKLGTVGNSGNAITTPPHLHFGIYIRRQGPLNPYNFVKPVPTDPPPILGDTSMLGEWGRIGAGGSTIRQNPGAAGSETGIVGFGTPVQIVGMTADTSLVRVPDGREGYVRTAGLVPAESSALDVTVERRLPLRDGPKPNAAVKAHLNAGQRISVLGQLNDFRLIRTADDLYGWLSDSET